MLRSDRRGPQGQHCQPLELIRQSLALSKFLAWAKNLMCPEKAIAGFPQKATRNFVLVPESTRPQCQHIPLKRSQRLARESHKGAARLRPCRTETASSRPAREPRWPHRKPTSLLTKKRKKASPFGWPRTWSFSLSNKVSMAVDRPLATLEHET